MKRKTNPQIWSEVNPVAGHQVSLPEEGSSSVLTAVAKFHRNLSSRLVPENGMASRLMTG
jgi:hypothetical protein